MTSKYSGHLLDQGHSDPRCWTTMFQKIKKNSPKFRLNVAWIGKTSNGKDFGDVTLAWEDEEQERKLMFQNCKWKWKYHDGTLAWRRRRKNGLKLNLGLSEWERKYFESWVAECDNCVMCDFNMKDGKSIAWVDLERWSEIKLKASEEEKNLRFE